MSYLFTLGPIITLSYAATLALDRNDGRNQKITLTGNIDFTAINNLEEGDFIHLTILEDGSGTHTITFSAGIIWPGGTEPTWDTAASARNTVFMQKIDGVILGNGQVGWA